MPEYVLTEFHEGVARIRMNRADKRNALRRESIEEMLQCVRDFADRPDLRVLVVEAAGSVFCAGMDLEQMKARAQGPDSAAELLRDSEVYCELLKALFRLPVPTIAVLQGPALAGGVGLVLACDLVLAEDGAFLMLPEPVRGITAAMVTPFLIHRVGSGPATAMLLSGERVAAVRAKELGLFHDVVAADQLADRTQRLIDAVLTGSPQALAITKQHVQRCSADVIDLVDHSIEVSAKARTTSDAQEGLAAFLEKRKPAWQKTS